jgi:hypothetical protein
VLTVLAPMLVLVEDVINFCSVNQLGLNTIGQTRLQGGTAVDTEGAYSRTPLIRKLVIRIANYSDRFGSSGKYCLTLIVLHLFMA